MTEPNFNFCEAKMETSLVTSSVQTPYPSPWPGGPGLAHYVVPPLPGQIRFAELCPGIYLCKLHIIRPGPKAQGSLISLRVLSKRNPLRWAFVWLFLHKFHILNPARVPVLTYWVSVLQDLRHNLSEYSFNYLTFLYYYCILYVSIYCQLEGNSVGKEVESENSGTFR